MNFQSLLYFSIMIHLILNDYTLIENVFLGLPKYDLALFYPLYLKNFKNKHMVIDVLFVL